MRILPVIQNASLAMRFLLELCALVALVNGMREMSGFHPPGTTTRHTTTRPPLPHQPRRAPARGAPTFHVGETDEIVQCQKHVPVYVG